MNSSRKYFSICALLLIVAIINPAQAWLAQAQYASKEHPGKCKISDTIIIAPGESVKSPNTCASIDCNNADGDATIRGCGAMGAPPNCEWGDYKNADAPYPDCCERNLKCDTSN